MWHIVLDLGQVLLLDIGTSLSKPISTYNNMK